MVKLTLILGTFALACIIQSTLSSPILKDEEFVAGLVLYKVEGGGIEYVLLQKEDELDDWSVPKGQVDKDENMSLGAMRECLEETSYDPGDYVAHFNNPIYFEYTTNDDILKRVTLFPAKLTNSDKPVVINPEEHASFDWLKYPAADAIIKKQYKDAFEKANTFIVSQENL